MIRKTGIILLCALMLTEAYAYASNARLSNVVVTNTKEHLILYLTVEGAFSEKLKMAVLSGVPITFTFYVQLYHMRRFWFDQEIAEKKITHTIKYHHMQQEYTIRRSWESDRPIVVRSFSEARKLMSEIDSYVVADLSQLEKGDRYRLKAKAMLDKLTLPFYLHYVLFFISLWDFETGWHVTEFIY